MSITIGQVRSNQDVLFRDIDGRFRTSLVVTLVNEQDSNSIYLVGIEAKVKESDTDQWTGSLLSGPSATEVRFPDVEVGTEYNIRVKGVYSNGTIGAWSESWGSPVESSHMIQGNLQLPPDPTALNIVTTIADVLAMAIDLPFIPPDLAGYEIRFSLGSTTDWDAMTRLGIFRSSHMETSFFPRGHYTFAAKSLSAANDPHEDAFAVPPTPKSFNHSANAIFTEYDVVDARPINCILSDGTTPTSIDGTVTTIANYDVGLLTRHATDLGMTFDLVTGIITIPATASDELVKLIGQVNLDISVSGSPANDTDIGLFIRTGSGDQYIGGNYIVDKNKQATLPLLGMDFEIIVAAGDTVALGISTVGGGSGNVGIISSFLALDYLTP